MSPEQTSQNKIFISYRRSDTEGYAGRLQDALQAYFGEHRIFRDVGGITPGEDFKEKIEATMLDAGALIVLIGPNWLVSSKEGQPRLHEPGDQVAEEIRGALEKGRVILPVLVQGATMPREEDLPEGLKALSRRNAVSISDAGWNDDTSRLAKVLSLDVAGSVIERKLELLKRVAISLIVLSVLVTSSLLFFDVYGLREASFRSEGESPQAWVQFVAMINPIFAILAGGILMWHKAWLDESSLKFVAAAIWLGAIGLFLTFVYYLYDARFPNGDEHHVMLLTSMISTLMLGLLAQSGFKPNDNIC